MELLEPDFDRYNAEPIYRVPPRRAAEKSYGTTSDYSNHTLAMAIGFCFLWLFYRLNRMIDNVCQGLRIAGDLIGGNRSESHFLSSATDDCHWKDNRAKLHRNLQRNASGSKKADVSADASDLSEYPSFTLTYHDLSQILEKKVMKENRTLRCQLLESEMKLSTARRQVMDLKRRIVRSRSIKEIVKMRRESPLSPSLACRRRSTYFDYSEKPLSIWSKGVNGESTMLEHSAARRNRRS